MFPFGRLRSRNSRAILSARDRSDWLCFEMRMNKRIGCSDDPRFW